MEKWQSNGLEPIIELLDKIINLIVEKNCASFDAEIVMLERICTKIIQLNEDENLTR